MKKILLTIALAGFVASAHSQGQINFESLSANGWVAISSAPDTVGNTSGTYTEEAPLFTATLWALSAPASSDSGLPGLDSYGNLDPADLISDGFSELQTQGGVSDIAGTDGNFDSEAVMLVPNVVNSETVFAVVCWTGSATTLAQAEANGDYLGILAFVNDTAYAPPAGLDGQDDTAAGWNTLANSPRSAAEGGDEDLIMYNYPIPEPTTLAFAGLGGLSMLLFRRRK